jgi:hypothetical protein
VDRGPGAPVGRQKEIFAFKSVKLRKTPNRSERWAAHLFLLVKTGVRLWQLLSCLIGPLKAQEWSDLVGNYTDTGRLWTADDPQSRISSDRSETSSARCSAFTAEAPDGTVVEREVAKRT